MLAQQASYLMVMAVVFLISLMAGRVFPMFTANGTQTRRVDGLPWLEKSTLAFTALSALLVSFPQLLALVVSSLILLITCSLGECLRSVNG